MSTREKRDQAPRHARRRRKRLAPVRSLEAEILAIGRRCAALPRRTARTPDEIIGYDAHGLPIGT
jgi:antitoxin VapB